MFDFLTRFRLRNPTMNICMLGIESFCSTNDWVPNTLNLSLKVQKSSGHSLIFSLCRSLRPVADIDSCGCADSSDGTRSTIAHLFKWTWRQENRNSFFFLWKVLPALSGISSFHSLIFSNDLIETPQLYLLSDWRFIKLINKNSHHFLFIINI